MLSSSCYATENFTLKWIGLAKMYFISLLIWFMGTCYFISLFINGELLRFLKLFIPIRSYYQYIIFSHQYFKLLVKICLKKNHNNQHGLSFNHQFFYCICRKPRLKKIRNQNEVLKVFEKCCVAVYCFVSRYRYFCCGVITYYLCICLLNIVQWRCCYSNYLDAYCENKTYIVSSN